MEKIAETINGLQHIGLPTNDLEKTVAFYEASPLRCVRSTKPQGNR